MAVTSVVNYVDARQIRFPVSGAGSNIPLGTLMMPGVATPYLGISIPIAASSNANVLGVLNDPHIYASSGDALTATLAQWYPLAGFNGASFYLGNAISPTKTAYPSHQFDLVDSAVLTKVSYSQTSTMAVASFVNATQIATITNDIAGKDSAFDYINGGTGIGQLAFVVVSAAGSETFVVGTKLTTDLDNTSTITQILPLFYRLPIWTANSSTAANYLDSAAAAGTGRALVVMNFININGDSFQLDPKTFHNSQKLNAVASLDFYSYIALQSSALHPIS